MARLQAETARVFEFGEGVSGLRDHRVARKLVEGVVTPADEENRRLRTIDHIFPSAFCQLIGVAHDFLAVQTGIDGYKAQIRSMGEQLSRTEATSTFLEEQLDGAKEKVKELQDDNDRLRKERKLAFSKLEEELQGASGLRQRLQDAQSALTAVQAEKSSAEARIAAVQADLDIARLEVQTARATMESERRAAVAEYKASAEYKAEVGKASDFFYLTGFADCREEFAREFPSLDVARVVIPVAADEEEPSGAEEGEIAEPTVGAADPVEAVTGPTVRDAGEDAPSFELIEPPTAAEAPTELPAEAATEELAEGPTEEPAEGPTEEPAEGPTERPEVGDVFGEPIEL